MKASSTWLPVEAIRRTLLKDRKRAANVTTRVLMGGPC